MCTDLGRWLPHNWGSQWFWGFDGWCQCAWEGGQVFKSSLSPSSSSFCPRYDSEGKYLGSLPDLATPRYYHGCTSFLTSNGEQVKMSSSCPILFLLYFKQALLVAGGFNDGRLASTETYSNGRWTPGGNLPR